MATKSKLPAAKLSLSLTFPPIYSLDVSLAFEIGRANFVNTDSDAKNAGPVLENNLLSIYSKMACYFRLFSKKKKKENSIQRKRRIIMTRFLQEFFFRNWSNNFSNFIHIIVSFLPLSQ